VNPLWILVGVAIAMLMAAPLAGPFGTTLLGLAGLALAGAIVKATVDRIQNRKYDLRALERVHIREELDEVEERDLGEIESITCPNCFQEVHPRYSVCPNCRASL